MGSVSKVFTAAVVGLDAVIVEVESDVTNGLPTTVIVGLPDASVQESKERVRSAIKNSGAYYPPTRVSVNMAPADVPKNGTQYDLPIALAILLSAEEIEFDTNDKLFVGELSLDGKLRPVYGVLSIALRAKSMGIKELFVPIENAEEAALVQNLNVIPVKSLKELLEHLLLKSSIPSYTPRNIEAGNRIVSVNLQDVAGQEHAKRALEIASAGNHNILLYGPPGSGKTLLAKACSGILPSLTFDEQLELTKIYSISGKLKDGVVTERPVRSPHHTTSNVALVGGGTNPKPGEITLAHRGVLFLDEFPEFPRSVLEALRQPLEDGVVTVSRARNTLTFPAKFILIAAQNPCPCGFYGDNTKQCTCTSLQITKYEKKVSGPLLDRIDLHVEVPRLTYEKLMKTKTKGESSEDVRSRVDEARKIQHQRLGGSRTNSEMSAKEVKSICSLTESCQNLLETAVNKFNLSGRSVHRILKVSRTIADLDKQPDIREHHLTEALQYRQQHNK
jgi:magnesium chelatase family protein